MIVLVGLVLAGPATGASSPFAETDTETPEPDGVAMTVTLGGGDTVQWTIEHRYRLRDQNETDAFDSLAADIEANTSAYTARFRERMNATVSGAETATGRDMQLTDITVAAEKRNLPQTYGIVRYQFTWAGFANVTGDRIVAGDAISGLFLEESMSLRIEWPTEYTATSVAPAARESGETHALWRGPTDFGAQEPRVVLERGTGTGTTGDLPWVALGGLGLLVVLGLGGGALWWTRRDTGGTPAPAATEPAPTSEEAAELLSNEEQVLQLLEDRGGRMKQQEVVDALGWTDAKTSQVVSSLREDGEIESFRLGRENVLRLPEVDEVDLPGEDG